MTEEVFELIQISRIRFQVYIATKNHNKKSLPTLEGFFYYLSILRIGSKTSHYLTSSNFCIREIGVNPLPDAVK